MIPADNILSNVNGTLNALTITGDAAGDIHAVTGTAPEGCRPPARSSATRWMWRAICCAGHYRPRAAALSFQWDAKSGKPCRCMPVSEIERPTIISGFPPWIGPGFFRRFPVSLGEQGISIKSVHPERDAKLNGSVPVIHGNAPGQGSQCP